MKKYTSYKVGLFISLLGFGTLTSCVSNTLPSYANNRRLGSGYSCYGLQKGCERHKGKIFIGAGLGLTASTIIALICYYGKALSTSLFTTGTCLVIVTPAGENIMLPKWNIAANKEHQIEELTRSVYKAIESGTQKWDKADSSLIDQFTQDINDTMTKFIGKQKLKYTNNFAVPYTISDPKVLDEETLENIDEETLENIKEARCDLDLIKCLINKGVDPNAKNSEGSSLLTPAVIYNNKDALKFLIEEKKANVEKADNAAAEAGVNSLLGLALVLGNNDIANYLIDNGSNLKFVNKKNGMTLLMTAALVGNVDIFKLLLEKIEKDRIICAKDKEGKTVKDYIEAPLIINEELYDSKKWYAGSNITKESKNDDVKKVMTEKVNKVIEDLHPQQKKCPGA